MAVEIILLIERGLNQETVFFTVHYNLTSGYFIFMFIRRLCPKKLHLDTYFGPQYCNPHIMKRN